MRQVRFLASVMLMTVVILLGFQNCGQPGQLTAADSAVSGSLSSSLEIGPVSNQTPNTGAPSSPVEVDGVSNINDISSEAICRDVQASDVMLNVDQVISDKASFQFIDSDHSISIAKAAVTLEASSSGEVSEIRMILNPEGNLLLGSNQAVYDLKSPSAQASGFEVRLAKPTPVIAGQKYNLQLNIDLSQQIVRAGKKCLLKPSIQAAVLKSI